jgi:2-polyprenyl-3-methyl-5-hydroxy-6-metoxy-1,4-benzoquinol methylase
VGYEERNKVESWHLSDTFSAHRYKQMARAVKNDPKKILDIGVGSGVGGDVLRAKFPNSVIIGLEAVGDRLGNARASYNEIVHGLATDKIFEDGNFDLVVAGELIEHIETRDVNVFFQQVFSILRLGGLFIFTTPNPNDIKMRLQNRSVLGGSHVSQHFIRETRVRLRLESFRVKRIYGTGRTSLFLGKWFPKFLYGSYMVIAEKR